MNTKHVLLQKRCVSRECLSTLLLSTSILFLSDLAGRHQIVLVDRALKELFIPQ